MRLVRRVLVAYRRRRLGLLAERDGAGLIAGWVNPAVLERLRELLRRTLFLSDGLQPLFRAVDRQPQAF